MRTRALLLVLLAGGLAAGVGAAVTTTAVASTPGHERQTPRARLDVSEGIVAPAVARVRDPSGSEQDSRRLDAVGLVGCAALLLGGWWIARRRHARRPGTPVAPDNRTRAPPFIPALVCS